MTHLTHDELVLSYYSEPGLGNRREHLSACSDCQTELARLSGVLDRVTPDDIPEPEADYEARVWNRLQWRLRGEARQQRRAAWTKWLAAAAMLALAFTAGLLWNRRQAEDIALPQTASSSAPATTTPASTEQQGRDRILLVVVGEHFDQSERMLVELTNLTPGDGVNIGAERDRAGELLVSNRFYRRNALHRGDEKLASLLDELEPVLLEIAHSPSAMSAEELRAIQKRVETKELVFKLRVVRADVRATATPHLNQPNV